jgi:hypothetical protein
MSKSLKKLRKMFLLFMMFTIIILPIPVKGVENLKIGNTPGNISNNGIVAKSNNKLYFRNFSDEGKLYSSDLDGSNSKKLSDDRVFFINVVEDWVYYTNTSDKDKLYKIKIDGTSRTKLFDKRVYYINVLEDWIYFCFRESPLKYEVSYSKFFNSEAVGKIKIDGTGFRELFRGDVKFLNVYGDYMYFSGGIYDKDSEHEYSQIFPQKGFIKCDLQGKNPVVIDHITYINTDVSGDWIYGVKNNFSGSDLYKIKTDGTDKQLIVKGIYALNVDEEWIYYTKDMKLYKRNKADNEEILVGYYNPHKFCIIDDNIYVTDESKTLYRQNIHNGTIEKIIGDQIDSVKKYKDYLYYKNFGNILYRCREDGKDKIKLQDEPLKYFNIDDEWIYYSDLEGKLYKIKIDGSQKTLLMDKKSYFIKITDQWLYYKDQYGRIWKMKKDGSENTILTKSKAYTWDIMKENLIFNDYDNNDVLCITKNHINDKIQLTEKTAYLKNIKNQYIYYNYSGEYNVLYRVKNDGTDKKKVFEGKEGSKIISFTPFKDSVYFFADGGEGYNLYRIKDSSNTAELVQELKEEGLFPQSPIRRISLRVIEDELYLIKSNVIYKLNIDEYGKVILIKVIDTEEEILMVDDEYFNGEIINEWIACYKEEYLEENLYMFMNIKTGEKFIADEYFYSNIGLDGDWMYYFSSRDSYKLYRIKKDGTGRATFGESHQGIR